MVGWLVGVREKVSGRGRIWEESPGSVVTSVESLGRVVTSAAQAAACGNERGKSGGTEAGTAVQAAWATAALGETRGQMLLCLSIRSVLPTGKVMKAR